MGRRASPRVLFGYFLHDAKSDNSFSFRKLRGSANLESTYRSRSFAPQYFKGSPRFCKPRISTHRQQTHAIQLNPFAATDGISLVAVATNLCASRHLPAAMPPLKLSFRKVCPCRNGTLRVLFRRLSVLFANRKAPYQKYLTR